MNPKVETRVVWVNKWFDPPKESEGAQALLNDGADVLMQNTDSSAVLQTAEKAGKFGFGWDSDMKKFGPTAHLGSAVINWAPYYKKAVGEALDGKWKTGQSLVGRQGRGHRSRLDLGQGARGAEAEGRGGEEGAAGRHVRDLEGPGRRPGRQGAAEGRARSPTTSSCTGINFYVKGVKGKPPKGS